MSATVKWSYFLGFKTSLATVFLSHSLLCISVIFGVCVQHMSHNDVIKWKHFPRYHPFVRGIHLHHCLLNRLFRRKPKKTSKYPVTGEFPAQRAGNAENVSIWWRHHGCSSDHFTAWPKLHRSNTAPTRETWIWIWTIYLFLDANTQFAGCGVMSTWLVPMIGNLRCCNNIHWGTRICITI